MNSSAQTSPQSNDQLSPSATWDEMIVAIEALDKTDLCEWIDDSLGELEGRMSEFVTPRSLKKSLVLER